MGILSQKTASQLHLHTQDLGGHFNPVGYSVARSRVDVLALQMVAYWSPVVVTQGSFLTVDSCSVGTTYQRFAAGARRDSLTLQTTSQLNWLTPKIWVDIFSPEDCNTMEPHTDDTAECPYPVQLHWCGCPLRTWEDVLTLGMVVHRSCRLTAQLSVFILQTAAMLWR